MSRERVQVSYDGPALSEHGMDVYALAPALLALGDLIREANRQVNGDRARVSVSVTEDFEHKCFNINLDIAQTILEQIKSFLAQDDVRTAKEILEWLELVAKASIPGGALGLFTYLKMRKGRKIENVTKIEDSGAGGNVALTFEGDRNQVIVNNNVYLLGENQKVRNAAKRVLEPLEREGFDEFAIRSEGEIVSRITKLEAEDAILSCTSVPDEEEALDPQVFTAHLVTFGAVFDSNAEKWRFRFGDKSIYADITETTIADDAIERGYVTPRDVYKVRLEMTEHRTPTDQFRTEYKVLEVLEFEPGGPSAEQLPLLKDD